MLFINTWKVGTELTAFAWIAQETTVEFTARTFARCGLVAASFSSRLCGSTGWGDGNDRQRIDQAGG